MKGFITWSNFSDCAFELNGVAKSRFSIIVIAGERPKGDVILIIRDEVSEDLSCSSYLVDGHVPEELLIVPGSWLVL